MAKVQLYGCAKCEIAIDCENRCAEHTPPCAKLADEKFNSLQQLKAEIAAIADELDNIAENLRTVDIIEKLRQLSAV